MKTILKVGLCAATILTPAMTAQAHDNNIQDEIHGITASGTRDHGSIHAPIGVMGDHQHDAGEWMLSYRYMRMEMSDMRDGTNDLSPEEIVGNAAAFPNPNAGPAGFRVIPDEMTMQMHMFGAMYGVTDWFTAMAMANYVKKDMNHITFAGMAGTTRLGEFETEASGWGDTSVGGMFKLYEDDTHHIHLNATLSLPTGSIKEEDAVLTPMGTTPTLRLPYAMQLGSGTYDALPGITYTGHNDVWNWGAQYAATIRLESENNQNYALGDKHKITGWGGYQFTPWLRATARLTAEHVGDIDGADPMIAAPVTTADPDNYGGKFVEGSLGFNIVPGKALPGAQMAAEFTAPLYQDLNGPQMKRDYGLMIGLQYAF
ncbi:MAG: transporter [Alphaproteobacteria bacterium]|nr:transporter [Alphaproteobacteria bacterium]